MRKTKQEGESTTTRTPSGGDNATTFGENASSAAFAKAITDDESGSEGGSRQDDQEEHEEEEEGGDGSDQSDGDDQDDESEGDEESSDDDDGQSGDDDDEEEEEPEAGSDDDGLGDLSHEEAIALARRQQKGVDKLRTRSEQLAEDLEKETARADSNQKHAEYVQLWDGKLNDPEKAPTAVAEMLAFVHKKHGISVAELGEKVLSIVKESFGLAMPDFEADARASAEEVEWADLDAKEDWIKATALHDKRRWERDQANKPKKSESEQQQQQQQDTAASVQAKFDRQFEDAVSTFKEEYPGFKLTKEMALEAVKAHPKTSVEVACFRMFRKQMNESLVRRTRKDTSKRPRRMLTTTGRGGGQAPPEKDQSKWTSADWVRAAKGG